MALSVEMLHPLVLLRFHLLWAGGQVEWPVALKTPFFSDPEEKLKTRSQECMCVAGTPSHVPFASAGTRPPPLSSLSGLQNQAQPTPLLNLLLS